MKLTVNKKGLTLQSIVIDLIILCGLWCLLLLKQSTQYANARIIGDWERIPLWYPWEVVDFGSGMGVDVRNWNSWKHKEDMPIVLEGTSTNGESAALSRLTDIKSLSIGDHVVCGIRSVSLPTVGYWGDRYFVFATNQMEVTYFKSRDDFMRECARYGGDGINLLDFHTCWGDYWESHGTINPFKMLMNCLRQGFSFPELIVVAILLYILYIRIRRFHLRIKANTRTNI